MDEMSSAPERLQTSNVNLDQIRLSLRRMLYTRERLLIKTTDGKSLTLAIGMIDKCNQHSGWDPTYGTFGSEDYYVLDDLNFGKNAISLYPLRKIIFKR